MLTASNNSHSCNSTIWTEYNISYCIYKLNTVAQNHKLNTADWKLEWVNTKQVECMVTIQTDVYKQY